MISKSCLTIDDKKILLDICGINDKNLKRLEKISNSKIYYQGNELYFEGENSERVEKTILALIEISAKGGNIYNNLIDTLYYELENNNNNNLSELLKQKIDIPKIKKVFNPRTINQGLMIKLLNEKDIIFCYGPAGTGKTFLAVAFAIKQLLEKKVRKIILTRPVVEAGENLGFLPGDYIQKIHPYLIPLFDAINYILPHEIYQKFEEQNLIEIAPLAYMRGRTFTNSIVILDEAQNTTYNQIKLFLTRPDETTKLIITGDITQIDLPKKNKSGMVIALKALRSINEIGFIEFNENDVIRHHLVKKIIHTLDQYEKSKNIKD